jgi:hypothetical protein
MKPFRFFAPACLAAATLFVSPLAQAQVLKDVPSDALLVVKFNKIKAVSDKIGAMATKLGIAQFNPQMTDPLGALKQEAKLTNGLDDAGDAALFIPNYPAENKGEPPVVLLLPVTDYKAFVANFEGAKTDGSVSTVKFGNNPQDSYIVNWDKFAAIGTTKDSVAKKPDGITPAGLSAKELDSKDVVTYVNMKTARNRILPAIAEHRAKFIAEMEKNMAKAGQPPRAARPRGANGAAPAPVAPDPAKAAAAAKFQPLMRAFMNRGIDVVEQLVRDTDAATYSINLTDAGINVTGLAEFAQGSPSAARVMTFTNTNKPLLPGLPASKYMFFGGAAGDPKVGQKVLVDFVAPVEKEFAALGEDGKAMQNWVDAMKSYLGAVNATAFGMVTPSGMLGQDAIVQAITVSKGDAKTIIESQKQAADSQQAVMEMVTGMGSQPKMKMTYNANAKTVDGVALNQMQLSIVNTPGQPVSAQQAQMQQMMTMMYGPGGFTAYIGKVADDKVLTAAGANDALLGQAVAAAKAGDDKITATAAVQATDAQLPKQRILAAYVGLDQIASTLANYAKAFGMPINFQVPADLPPLGFTFGSDGAALRADGHIPAQTLQSLIAAGMQTYMQMQGGQQPGGPGGL